MKEEGDEERTTKKKMRKRGACLLEVTGWGLSVERERAEILFKKIWALKKNTHTRHTTHKGNKASVDKKHLCSTAD